MARISFKLSDQRLNTGGSPGQLSAPQLGGGSGSGRGIHAPEIRAPQADAAVLPSRQKDVPLIDPQVLNHTANVLIDASMRFNDRQAEAEAEDALLRANSAANELFAGVDQDGNATGYGHKIGKDAIDTYEDFSKGIDATYEQFLPAGDLARSKYLNKAMQYRERARNAGADHRVKQQEVYEGGQRYARGQQLIEDFQTYGETVFQPGPDGLSQFEKALQGYKTPEEMEQVRSALYKNIVNTMLSKVDDVDATNELGKLKLVKDFNDRYATMNSPFKRAEVDTVINNGIVAAQRRQKSEYKENMAKVRAVDLANAPSQMFSAMSEGNMTGVLNTLQTMKRGYAVEDADNYVVDAGQAMQEMVQVAFDNGKNTYQIEENLNVLDQKMTERGVENQEYLMSKAKRTLRSLQGTERAMKATGSKAAYNTVLNGAFDENGNFDVEKAKKLGEQANLETGYQVKLKRLIDTHVRRQRTAKLKVDTEVQKLNLGEINIALELEGTKGLETEEFIEEMNAQAELGRISELGANKAIMNFAKTKKREEREAIANPEVVAIRQKINGYVQAKLFTGKSSDSAENVLANKEVGIQLVRDLNSWVKSNPQGDVRAYWAQREKEMADTGWFGKGVDNFSNHGLPTFKNPAPETPQPAAAVDSARIAELEKKALPLPDAHKAWLNSKNGRYERYLNLPKEEQQKFINDFKGGNK